MTNQQIEMKKTEIEAEKAAEIERANKAEEKENRRRNTLGAISNIVSAFGGPIGRVAGAVIKTVGDRKNTRDKNKSQESIADKKLEELKLREQGIKGGKKNAKK